MFWIVNRIHKRPHNLRNIRINFSFPYHSYSVIEDIYIDFRTYPLKYIILFSGRCLRSAATTRSFRTIIYWRDCSEFASTRDCVRHRLFWICWCVVPDRTQTHVTYGVGGVRAREQGVGSYGKIFCTLITLSKRMRGGG